MLALRTAAFTTWMFALAGLMGLVCLPLLLGSRKSALAAIRLWASWCLAGLGVITGLRVDVRGVRPPAGPVLVAAKHQGLLDFLVGLTLFADPCFVLKRELMWIPILGWFSAKAEMISIDRSAGAQAVRGMLNEARVALSQDRQMIIYPEGSRRAPAAPPDYKPGVAGLYRDLNVVCFPLATNSGLFWSAESQGIQPGVAVFEFLEPILPGLSRRAFMDTMSSRIEAASSALAPQATTGAQRDVSVSPESRA